MSDEMLSLVQDLLDRQLLDRKGTPCGNVDDIEFDWTGEIGDPPVVTNIISSPAALGPRIGTFLGRWMVSAWHRLHPAEDPEPIRIPYARVSKLDYAVHLDVTNEELGLDRSERWAREAVISRIPGS
jgi:sporulation protein YlmC with PRC-barrel domain